VWIYGGEQMMIVTQMLKPFEKRPFEKGLLKKGRGSR
jgi:hypothetical protein